MRGKVTVNADGTITHGITPAYAGKRQHPMVMWFPMTGSPPPMRGKDKGKEYSVDGERITPAYAGKRTMNSTKIIAL